MKCIQKKVFLSVLLAASSLPTGNPAQAQQEFPIVTSVETNYIGAGIGVVPDYVGSDEYTWGVLPTFRYEFGDHRNIELIGNYISANVIDNPNMRLGPAFRYHFGRESDIDDPVSRNLPDINDTIEGGITFSGNWIIDNNPRERFTLGMDALWDLGEEYEGFSGTAYARYWAPLSQAIDLGIAGGIQYADDNYNDTYFGISPEGSAATGMPVFDADGGLSSFSITPMAVLHLSENWHLGGGLRYMRLTGDAADSPLVDDRGNPNQIIGGIGVVYSWGTKVN